MARQVLTERPDARTVIEVLSGVRSIVDVNVWTTCGTAVAIAGRPSGRREAAERLTSPRPVLAHELAMSVSSHGGNVRCPGLPYNPSQPPARS